MTSLPDLSEQDIRYLQPYLPRSSSSTHVDDALPFVTLTYAMALDGLISISPGFRTIISGPQTKTMTHFLRSKHDAILVGSKTAIYDNPSLNCRYADANIEQQPQPVILDVNLDWQIKDKQVVQLSQQGKGRKPWVLAHAGAVVPEDYPLTDVDIVTFSSFSSRLDWNDILKTLKSRGIHSIMIEGGASILKTLLQRPDLVDSVIVTVAPTWLGTNGTSAHVAPARSEADGQHNAARLRNVSWHQFGEDMVLCGRLQERTRDVQ